MTVRLLPLLALTLASSWMLWCGLAIAIPIAIHLWNRKRTVETPWAASQFLDEAIRETARQVRVERRSLLALRCAIIAAFTLALAEPLSSVSLTEQQPHHLILVVDTSYSMRAETGRGTRFAFAKQQLRQAIERCPSGSRFSIFSCDAKCEAVVSLQPSQSIAIGELQSLSLSDNVAMIQKAVEPILVVIRRAQTDYPQLRTRVLFASDLAANTWEAIGESFDGPLLSRFSDYNPQVIDVGQDQIPNIAVTGARVVDDYVIAGRPATIEIDVANYASTLRSVNLSVAVGGRSVDVQSVSIPPFESVTQSVQHSFSAVGEQLVEVRLEPDALPTDDVRRLVVDVHKKLQVLCVECEPSAGDYVVTALTAADEDIVIDRCDASRLPADISYDCIILCDATRMEDKDIAKIDRSVGNGSGLLVSLGPSTSRLSQEFASNELFSPIGTAVADVDIGFEISQLNHSIMTPFRTNPRTGLNEVAIWSYWKLSSSDDTTPVLLFTNGDPAIQTKPFGLGQIAYVATSLSTVPDDNGTDGWNTIAVLPSFVPLLHRTIGFTVGAISESKTITVSEPIIGPARSTSESLKLFRSASPEQSILINTRRDSVWQSPAIELSGFYKVQQTTGEADSNVGNFAVNVDTAESNLARVDESLIPDWLSVHTGSDPAVEMIDTAAHPRSWVPAALLMVALLLVAEPIYAAWEANR